MERLSHGMCDIKMFRFNDILKEGYWPKLRLHTGDEMPVRSNNVKLLTKHNMKEKLMIEDLEGIIREGILKGKIELVSVHSCFSIDATFFERVSKMYNIFSAMVPPLILRRVRISNTWLA